MAKQEKEKKSLKGEVIETAHAIADAGEVAEGVSETVKAVVPRKKAKKSEPGKRAVQVVAGTVTGTAKVVAKVGKVAGRVADALEGTALQSALARGRLSAAKAGTAVEKIVEHVAETGQPVVLLSGGRAAAAVVPYEVYKAGAAVRKTAAQAVGKKAEVKEAPARPGAVAARPRSKAGGAGQRPAAKAAAKAAGKKKGRTP